ncbi:GMP synthase [Sulfolobus sp. A20]|uniref:GMP synthase (glutamine-hydrolyzing) n=1 Tax=Sulfolobaceae TaxID=118883 RepID=UPI000845CD6C|nr:MULTISPECIES: ATP-binding protein [unclassified Sulfolobus]TRM76346.1 GMP synthase [Sulfolobus sp. E5]TRM76453.1 GMP synthase [Sulfolobus sp. A20-N-F8]TRM76573.1 GMP synthase [Sulfolobus sp. B5]TRM83308.1 GMP synthase [Sulfolobus sp. A20-N-F6]TRM89749.1 GMP synthase [Sulfolobus sp. C3]TRN01215.1 GMP synthase [Sulfolobus sp. F1]TRN03469.1 GMP synthase [Sulfolobus sp. E1]
MFDPSSFIEEISPQLKEKVGNEKVLAAVSGGVDSTTAAVLGYRILGERIVPVLIDTGFLRKDEAKRVKNYLKDVLPNLEVIDESDKFISSLEGTSDAEEKRRKFRDLFYSTISSLMRKYDAKLLMQGTIAADWVETQGGIKTQHNVLVQIGINTEKTWGFTVIEPLADLYKNEVRELARYLKLPREISERQPFPGPGLLVRTVGKFTKEKLSIVREANEIVESYLNSFGYSQYFAVIFESDGVDTTLNGLNVYKYLVKATGVKGDVRSYGNIIKLSCKDITNIKEIIDKLQKYDVTHVLCRVREKQVGKYSIGIRAVLTEDFMTADYAKIPIPILDRIAEEIVNKFPEVKEVLYDVTSKPPATIEFE